MSDLTQEEINEAIEACHWKSQNRFVSNAVPDICSSMCVPCQSIIDNGKCETLKELFQKRG